MSVLGQLVSIGLAQLYSETESVWVVTFLQYVEMFPENVADVRRGTEEEAVSSLPEQVDAAVLELSGVDALQVEVVDGPLQPVTHVRHRPLRRIYAEHNQHIVTIRRLQ